MSQPFNLLILATDLFLGALSLWHFVRIQYILRHGTLVEGHMAKKRLAPVTTRSGVRYRWVAVFSYYDDKRVLRVNTQHVSKRNFDRLDEKQLVTVSYLPKRPDTGVLGGQYIDYEDSREFFSHLMTFALFAVIVNLVGIVVHVVAGLFHS